MLPTALALPFIARGSEELARHTVDKKILGSTPASDAVYAMVPLFAAALAWLFFSQAMTMPMVPGMALTLGGLRLILRKGD